MSLFSGKGLLERVADKPLTVVMAAFSAFYALYLVYKAASVGLTPEDAAPGVVLAPAVGIAVRSDKVITNYARGIRVSEN